MFSLHNLSSIYFSYTIIFSGFYRGNQRQKEEIYIDLKICTRTWFAGLRVFPGLVDAGTKVDSVPNAEP